MRPHDLAFLWPLLASAWAAVMGWRAAAATPERRLAWRSWGAACAIACGASLLAVVAPASASGGVLGLYVGLAASGCVLLGSGAMARSALREKGWPAMIDPVLLSVVAASLAVYLLVLPGFRTGDPLLTVVLIADVVSLVLAAAAAAGSASAAVKGWLLGVVTTVCLGDGAAVAASSGVHFLPTQATPALWGVASACCGWAAVRDRRPRTAADPLAEPPAWAAYVQTLLPLAAILAYPAIVGALATTGSGAWPARVAFFAPLFLATTTIAFARQGVLLIESRRAAVRERRLTAEALRRNSELETLYHERLEAAIRDPLTGLYNRRYFYEAFGQEIARHERYGTGAALVLFDLDDFRAINDDLGAQCADDVLEQVGRIIGGLTRPTDIFARTGGEEFGLLMPETSQLDALLVAERLRTAVARHRVLGDRPLTMSGGVAAMPKDGTTREDLQRQADLALHWAKRNGKNMCAVASEAIETETEAVKVDMLAHLHGVVAGIDAVQLHTRDHSENVASYAVAIAGALGLGDDRIVRVRRAAFLHDIGKVAVSDTILGKPAALTDEEYEAIKVHPRVGETMLHHAGLHEEARWVGAHHERLDGRGYPQGLRGDEIPLEARIIFVADSFEAMTSDRPYSRGKPVPDALEELRRCSGTQFDPKVAEALIGLVEQDRLVVLALRDPA